MNSAQYRFLGAVFLFGLWGLLVVGMGAPVGQLVDAIYGALIGLGVFHATTSNKEVPK